MHAKDEESGTERPINGWREIAAFFGRNQSTVKRWAKDKALPVHRVPGEHARPGVPVYAYRSELDAWLRARKREGEAAEFEPDRHDPTSDPVPIVLDRRQAREVRRPFLVAATAVLITIVVIGGVAMWNPGTGSHGGMAQVHVVPEEAREHYLRGTYLWNRRTPEGISGAIEALERAIELHPDYAEAHAGLAMTYNLARQYSAMSGWEAYPKAEAAARRAVELDPTLALAHSALAFVEFHWLWDVKAGLARFEEALRLDPKSANTLMWYASSLLIAGRPADALPVINRAQELDPHNSAVFNMKAMAQFYNGQVANAIAGLQDIMERDPSYAWPYYSMYMIQIAQGDYQGYLENYARLGDMIGVPRYRAAAERGAEAFAAGGAAAMAAAMTEVEADYYERGEALAWDVARHHAMIGNWRQAMHWLRISLDRREERLIGILVDTAFWPIQNKSEFKRLVAEIGLTVDS